MRDGSYQLGKKNHQFIHGLTGTPTYKSWCAMIERTTNKKSKHYKRYGARGIKVTKRWTSFVSFVEDMGLKPSGTSIGRINNELGYSKSNCRWETPKEQSANRRVSRFVVYNGEKIVMAELARRLGMSRQVIRYRLNNGWSLNDIVKTKPNYGNGWIITKGTERVRS